MGSSKKQTVGYWYRSIFHHGLCIGPIDAFLEFRGGELTAWSGEITPESPDLSVFGQVFIDSLNLWGGEKDQGGIQGNLKIMFGEADQQPDDLLTTWFGDQQPAWRGLTTLRYIGRYGAISPYPPNPSYKVRQIKNAWGDGCWYEEKAEIDGSNFQTVEDFSDGLSAYSLELGSFSDFTILPTIYGDAMHVASTVGESRIFRSIFPGRPGQITFRFRIDSIGEDDAGRIYFLNSNGDDVLHFVTAREAAVDSNRRPQINPPIGGSGVLLGSEQLIIGTWYQFVMTFSWGESGSVTAEIFNGSTLVASASIAISGEDTISQLQFGTDVHTSGVGESTFADIQVLFASGSMNPAHILMYMRTQQDAAGVPMALIDDDSFTTAADWFYDNNFGLCTKWLPGQESINEFEQRIFNVAACSVNRDARDGKWYIDVANGEYDLESLPILTDDDVLSFKKQPTLIDTAANSLSLKYFDPVKKEEITTAPVEAQPLIDEYGRRHQTLDMPEIPTVELALLVAQRELKNRVVPLIAFEITTTRKPYAWRVNTYFRLQAPKRGIADMVCLLGEKSTGTLKSGAIKITATQDVFSFPDVVFSEQEPGVDITTPTAPKVITQQHVFESPYIDVVSALSRADLEVLPDDVGFLQAVAVDPDVSFDYTMFVDTGAGYSGVADGDWCPSATVIEEAGYLDTSFTFDSGFELDDIEVGVAVLWDNEICRLDALDIDVGTIDLGRGCADTLPTEHSAGSRIYFWHDYSAVDTTEYTDAETIDVKLATNSGTQQVPLSLATQLQLTFDQRWFRPYPPADLTINSQYFPTEISGALDLGWAHRDRVLQADQLIDTTAADVGPEVGQTYTVKLYNELDVLVRTVTDISSGSYEWTTEVDDSNIAGGGGGEDWIAYWTMTNVSGTTLIDEGGNYDGTITDANVVGSVMQFDGFGDNVAVTIPALGSEFTYAAFVTLREHNGYAHVFSDSNQSQFAIKIARSGLSPNRDVYFYDGSSSHFFGVSSDVSYDVEFFLILRYTGTDLELYIDNSLIDSTTVSLNITDTDFRMGGGPNGEYGEIDLREVYIFGRALNASEMTDLYNEESIVSEFRINGKITFELFSVRDGVDSLYKHNLTVRRVGWNLSWNRRWNGGA